MNIKTQPRQTSSIEGCTHLLSLGLGSGSGLRRQQEPGLEQGSGKGLCPSPMCLALPRPARLTLSLIHFQSISEFPRKEAMGVAEGHRVLHRSRAAFASCNHLLLTDLTITSLAGASP